MLRAFSCLKKNCYGQSLVEFALVLPILLALVMGIIQFGIILNGYVTITHAVREGARLAAVGRIDGPDGAYERMDEIADIFLLTLEDVDIAPYPTVPMEPVTVSAEGSVPVILPVILTNPFPVSSSTTIRVEVASD